MDDILTNYAVLPNVRPFDHIRTPGLCAQDEFRARLRTVATDAEAAVEQDEGDGETFHPLRKSRP